MPGNTFWDIITGAIFPELIPIRQRARIEAAIRQQTMEQKASVEGDALRREMVYQVGLGMKRLEKYLDKAPAGVFIGLTVLLSMLDDCGVFSINFSELSYKEETDRLRAEIKKVIDIASTAMGKEVMAQVTPFILTIRKGDAKVSQQEIEKATKAIEKYLYEDKNGKSLGFEFGRGGILNVSLPQGFYQKIVDGLESGAFGSSSTW